MKFCMYVLFFAFGLVYSSHLSSAQHEMPDSPLPFVAVDTDMVPIEDRVDLWRTAVAGAFDVRPCSGLAPSAFHASMQGYNLGEMLVGTMRDNGMHYSSSTSPARTDHILIQAFLAGGHVSELDEREVVVKPGQTGLLDLARPIQSKRVGHAHVINLVLPREALAGLPDLHGATLEPRRGEFLADYLRSLLRVMPVLAQSDAAALARITRDVAAVCLRPTPERCERARPQIEAGVLRRAKRLVESRLCSPELSPALLCRELGVSRSTLYRLFAPLGGVARYIQGRRLGRIHELIAGAQTPLRLGELARQYGFSDGAHLSRAFRARYGHAPSETREVLAQVGAPPAGPALGGAHDPAELTAWFRQLGR